MKRPLKCSPSQDAGFLTVPQPQLKRRRCGAASGWLAIGLCAVGLVPVVRAADLGPAMDSYFTANPSISANVTPVSQTVKEGSWAIYTVEGTDMDTRKDTVTAQLYEEGDPTIRVEAISVPSSTRVATPAITLNDPDHGHMKWTCRVKTRTATQPEDLYTDSWGVHDSWGIPPLRLNFNRMDTGPGGSRYIAGVQPTVIITPKRGDMQGTVKDASTGYPIGNAELNLVDCDPDMPDDFFSQWSSTLPNGNYYWGTMYASWNTVRVTAPGYLPTTETVTVPEGGVLSHDFYLTPDTSDCGSGCGG